MPLKRCAALFVLALAFMSCAPARIEAIRVQRANIKVLAEGLMNPLTGEVSETPQPWQERPVLAVKIGNSNPERPQSGLDRADLVYEELTEGGETRFLAMFLTNSPDRVGPVRSCRTVDPAILAPTGALFGYSGGVGFVISAVRAVPNVTDVGADLNGDDYYRDPNRKMPYNLYTSATRLWSGHSGTPPQKPQFEFLGGADDISAGGSSGRQVSVTFEQTPVRYGYDAGSGKYLRYSGTNAQKVESGLQLAFRNVVIEIVEASSGSYTDSAGNPTHDFNLVGSGRAIVLRGGKAFEGKWTRSSRSEPTKFTDASGNPLTLAPGRTIVELLPSGQQVSYS